MPPLNAVRLRNRQRACRNNNEEAARFAQSDQSADCVRRLLAAGTDPNRANSWGWTTLHWACFNNNEEAARALLADPRTDRNRRDKKRGKTAADVARSKGYAGLAALAR